MTVKSTYTSDDAHTETRGYAAPLPRRYLDTSRRPARVLFGAAFVAYSSIGTILGVQSDLAPALANHVDGAILGYSIGVAVAIVIFVAELLLAESAFFWYLIFLAPDAWYTYRFSGWIGAVVQSRIADPWSAQVVTVAVTGLFAIAVAYFGERLLFGKRR